MEQDNVKGWREKFFKFFDGRRVERNETKLIADWLEDNVTTTLLQQNKELQESLVIAKACWKCEMEKSDDLKEALCKIEQMSDPGSYETAIINMKQIATKALKP